MFTITQNQTGALPQVIPFKAPIAGNLTIAFSGTCWSKASSSLGGVAVFSTTSRSAKHSSTSMPRACTRPCRRSSFR